MAEQAAISMGMLRQGARYIERDRIPNVYLARARVEALPFRPAFLDGAVCGGSLHLFADTVAALREIAQRAAALHAEGWSAQTRPQDETARRAAYRDALARMEAEVEAQMARQGHCVPFGLVHMALVRKLGAHRRCSLPLCC